MDIKNAKSIHFFINKSVDTEKLFLALHCNVKLIIILKDPTVCLLFIIITLQDEASSLCPSFAFQHESMAPICLFHYAKKLAKNFNSMNLN